MKIDLLMNLRNRFDAVEFAFAHKNPDYVIALNEYLGYIAENKDLGSVLKTVLLQEHVSDKIVEQIYMISSIYLFIQKESGLEPSFWDLKIEEKYKLREKYLKLLEEEVNKTKLVVGKEDGKKMMDKLEINRNTFSISSSELLQLKMLNNHLIKKLSEKSNNIKSIKFFQTTNQRGLPKLEKIEIDGKVIVVKGKMTTLQKLFNIWYERGMSFQSQEKRRQFLLTLSNPSSPLGKLKYSKEELDDMFVFHDSGGKYLVKFKDGIVIN